MNTEQGVLIFEVLFSKLTRRLEDEGVPHFGLYKAGISVKNKHGVSEE